MKPPVESYVDLLRNDNGIDEAFRRKMVEHGFLIMPVSLRRAVISASHTEQDIRSTLDSAKQVLEENAQSSQRILAS